MLNKNDPLNNQRDIFQNKQSDMQPKSASNEKQNRRKPIVRREISANRIQGLTNKGDPIFQEQKMTQNFKTIAQTEGQRSPGLEKESSSRFLEGTHPRYPAFMNADQNQNAQLQASDKGSLKKDEGNNSSVFQNGGEQTPCETFEQGLQTANFNFSLGTSSKQKNESAAKVESRTEDFKKEGTQRQNNEYLNRRQEIQKIQIANKSGAKDTVSPKINKNASDQQNNLNLSNGKRMSPQKQTLQVKKPVLTRKTSDVPTKNKNNTLLPPVEQVQNSGQKEGTSKNSVERFSRYATTNNQRIQQGYPNQQELLELPDNQQNNQEVGDDQFSDRSGNYQLSSNLSTGQPNTRRSQKILNDYFQSVGGGNANLNARPIGAALRSNSHAARGRQKDGVNVPLGSHQSFSGVSIKNTGKSGSIYTKTAENLKQKTTKYSQQQSASLRTDGTRQVVTTASTSISQNARGGGNGLNQHHLNGQSAETSQLYQQVTSQHHQTSQLKKTINVSEQLYDRKRQNGQDVRGTTFGIAAGHQNSSEYLKPLRNVVGEAVGSTSGAGNAAFRPTRNRTTDTHHHSSNIISSLQSQGDMYRGSMQHKSQVSNVYVSPLKRDQQQMRGGAAALGASGSRMHVSEQRPMHRSHADQRIRPLVISNSGGPVSRENQRNQLKTQKLYGDTLAGKGSTRQIQKSLLSGQLAASAHQLSAQNGNSRQLVQSSMPQISLSFKGSTQIPTLKKSEKSVTKKRIPKVKKGADEAKDNFPKDELLVTFFDKKMASKDQQQPQQSHNQQVQSQGRKRPTKQDAGIGSMIDKDETRRQIQMQGTYNNRQTAGHANPGSLMADFSDRGDRDWEPEARKSVKSEMVRNLVVGQRRADTISHVQTKNLFQNEETSFDATDQISAHANDDLNSQWPSQKLNSMLFSDNELSLPAQHSNSVENHKRKMPAKNFNSRLMQYKTESIPSENLSQKSDLQATDINKLHPQGLYLGKDSRKTSTQKLNLKRNSISCQQNDSLAVQQVQIKGERSDEKPLKKKDIDGLYLAQHNQMLVQECDTSQSDMLINNIGRQLPFASAKNEEEQSIDNMSSNSIKQNFKYFQGVGGIGGRINSNQRSNNNSFEKQSPLTRTFEFNGKGQKARVRKLPSQINAVHRKQSDMEADRESQRSLVESANQLIRAQQENRLQFLQSAGSFGSMESHGSRSYVKEFKSNPTNFQIQKWNQDNSPNLQNQQNSQKFGQFFANPSSAATVNTTNIGNKVKSQLSQPFNLSQTNPTYNNQGASFWDNRIGAQPVAAMLRGTTGTVGGGIQGGTEDGNEQLVNFYDPDTSLIELSQEVNLISTSAKSTLTTNPTIQHHVPNSQTQTIQHQNIANSNAIPGQIQGQSPYNPRFLTAEKRSAGNQRCMNTLNGSYNTIKINGQTKNATNTLTASTSNVNGVSSTQDGGSGGVRGGTSSLISNGFPMMGIANSHYNLNQSQNHITASQLENSVDLSRSFNTIQNGGAKNSQEGDDSKQMAQNETQNPFKKGPKLHLYKKSRRIKTSSAARQIQNADHSQENGVNLVSGEAKGLASHYQKSQMLIKQMSSSQNLNTTSQVTRQGSKAALNNNNEEKIQSQIQSASGNVNIDQFLAKANNGHHQNENFGDDRSKFQKTKNGMGIKVSKEQARHQVNETGASSLASNNNYLQSDKNPYLTNYRKTLDNKLRPHTTENNVNQQIVDVYQSNEIQASHQIMQQNSPKPVQRFEKIVNSKQQVSQNQNIAPYANAPYFQISGTGTHTGSSNSRNSTNNTGILMISKQSSGAASNGRNRNNQSQRSRESNASSRKDANNNKNNYQYQTQQNDVGSLIQTAKFSTGSQSHFETFRQGGLKGGVNEPQHSYLLEDYGVKQSRKTLSGQSRSSASHHSQQSGGGQQNRPNNLSKNRSFLTKITNNSVKLTKKDSSASSSGLNRLSDHKKSNNQQPIANNNTPVQIAYDVKPTTTTSLKKQQMSNNSSRMGHSSSQNTRNNVNRPPSTADYPQQQILMSAQGKSNLGQSQRLDESRHSKQDSAQTPCFLATPQQSADTANNWGDSLAYVNTFGKKGDESGKFNRMSSRQQSFKSNNSSLENLRKNTMSESQRGGAALSGGIGISGGDLVPFPLNSNPNSFTDALQFRAKNPESNKKKGDGNSPFIGAKDTQQDQNSRLSYQ